MGVGRMGLGWAASGGYECLTNFGSLVTITMVTGFSILIIETHGLSMSSLVS